MQSALILWDKLSFYIIALYIDLKLHLFFTQISIRSIV